MTFIYDGTQFLMMPTVEMIQLPNENYYSTSEKIIGAWIDGKTLYQKTINFGALPNATQKNVAHNISNLGNVIDMKAWLKVSNSWYTMPFLSTSSAGENANWGADATNVFINTKSNYSTITTCYITIQYTKTS